MASSGPLGMTPIVTPSVREFEEAGNAASASASALAKAAFTMRPGP